jgi:hypothetical protein
LKWPKKLDVTGLTELKVFYVDRATCKKLFPVNGNEFMGLTTFHDGHIYVCTEYPDGYWDNDAKQHQPTPERMLKTLLHELMHHIGDAYQMRFGETETEVMAREVLKFILACGIKIPPLKGK